ncbi:uncharacterized protein LOC110189424 [Drosophila serrata]|uniref:uncharacterized protein LOC110189424 n=1 Tax=Drosophila serrata TaxID=7274 RepID=UPI000A1D04E1|nr:uncharacterized protein LOC110189424 [Drosophila serrata]
MKKLTYILLSAAIFAAVLFNTTTPVLLPTIFEVFRPISEYLGKKNSVQEIKSAIDIYIKYKKINEQVPKEEANLIESLLTICGQQSKLFEILGKGNKCTISELQNNLLSIVERLNKPKPV